MCVYSVLVGVLLSVLGKSTRTEVSSIFNLLYKVFTARELRVLMSVELLYFLSVDGFSRNFVQNYDLVQETDFEDDL